MRKGIGDLRCQHKFQSQPSGCPSNTRVSKQELDDIGLRIGIHPVLPAFLLKALLNYCWPQIAGLMNNLCLQQSSGPWHHRYRKWSIAEDVDLVVRCELDGVMEFKGVEQLLLIKALNEYDSKVTGEHARILTDCPISLIQLRVNEALVRAVHHACKLAV